MEAFKKKWQKVPEPLRKILVLIIGTLMLIAGIIMLAIPGPGGAAIFLALAIFASEFAVARRAKSSLIQRFKKIMAKVKKTSKT